MIDRQFVTAGRAVFTVQSPTGNHYTFKVRKKAGDPTGQYRTDAYFVSCLHGSMSTPSTERRWDYMGMLNPDTFEVRLTRNSKYAPTDLQVKVAKVALKRLGDEAASTWDIMHEGHCGRCGRELTDPTSLDRGIGPDCWALMGGDGDAGTELDPHTGRTVFEEEQRAVQRAVQRHADYDHDGTEDLNAMAQREVQ
jgi:hypothetical protein